MVKPMAVWRYYFIVLLLLLGALFLIWRMIDLNIIQRKFLQGQSNARILRVASIPAYRGMVTDRFSQPLAISAQVDSIWVNPQSFEPSPLQLEQLSQVLKIPVSKLQAKLSRSSKGFIYLKRGVCPAISEAVQNLQVKGVFCQHEYHRFYPQSEVTAHVVGLTNIDDKGQEGLELAYDSWLRGVPGKKKVLKDRLGHIIMDLGIIQQPKQGHNLALSLDSRIQYLAFEELKAGLQRFSAKSGSAVVLDVKTGEILAMVNQPSFNPNHVEGMSDGRYRNRAMTDMFEPGSTIKPFCIMNALESGRYQFSSTIDTTPGWLAVGGNIVRDEHSSGVMSLAKILQVSSDVGVAKIALSLPANNFADLLHRVGFGERTNTGFPGEATGTLAYRAKWKPIELATLSFGYGISVTAVQLAQAYGIIAANGLQRPVNLLKVNEVRKAKRVLPPNIAQQMLVMLEAVVKGGTGSLAKVPGYRVAGKTGTAYMASKNGYEKSHYVSSFAGIAPVSNPRLVVVVIVKDPRGTQHQGGMVAAPIFGQIMAGALRLLNVPPDDTTAY